MRNSLGGYLIGQGGEKIQKYTSDVNSEYEVEGKKQFIRVRLLGKLFHCKSKNKGKD